MSQKSAAAKLALSNPVELSNAELTNRITYLMMKTEKQQLRIINYHKYTSELEKRVIEFSKQHAYMQQQVNKAVNNVDARIKVKAKKIFEDVSIITPVVVQLLEKMSLIAEEHEKKGYAFFRGDRAFDPDKVKQCTTALDFIEMANKSLKD